jgi:hypothetical protein
MSEPHGAASSGTGQSKREFTLLGGMAVTTKLDIRIPWDSLRKAGQSAGLVKMARTTKTRPGPLCGSVERQRRSTGSAGARRWRACAGCGCAASSASAGRSHCTPPPTTSCGCRSCCQPPHDDARIPPRRRKIRPKAGHQTPIRPPNHRPNRRTDKKITRLAGIFRGLLSTVRAWPQRSRKILAMRCLSDGFSPRPSGACACGADVAHHLLGGHLRADSFPGSRGGGFVAHLHSLTVTMSQKSSVPQPARSVSTGPMQETTIPIPASARPRCSRHPPPKPGR